MKKPSIVKRLTVGALAAVMMFGTAAVSASAADIEIGNKNTQTSITLPVNGSGPTLELNRTYNLPTIISGLTGTAFKVSISNNRVLNYKNGKLTAVGTGSATVTITLKNGKKLSHTFNVKKPEVTISFQSKTLNLLRGQTRILKPVLSQSKAVITWKSSNNKIVTVDQKGRIKAVKAGKAVITAQLSSGKKASVTINVGNPVEVNSLALNATGLTIRQGSKYQLKTTVAPSNASDKTLTFTSSDSKVATVLNGLIKAKAPGTARITVRSANGKTASCTVRVLK